jgi:rhodanese-related sulfurtransferase
MSITSFIQANIWLVLLAVASGSVLLWTFIGPNASGGKQVGPLALVQLMNRNQAVVVDVREEAEYVAGHVLGSKHITLGTLKERFGELQKAKAKNLVVVCQTGSRSNVAAGILRKNGFADVTVLGGGINAWQQANLPLERG